MKKKHKQQNAITLEQLRILEPISSLSNERLEELIPLVYVEQLVIGGNLFREGDIDNQTVYLLKGDVQLASSDGKIHKAVSGQDKDARFPMDDSQPRQATCSALTRVDVLRIDNSVLDYMMMWDQLAVSESTAVSNEEKEPKVPEQTKGLRDEVSPVPVDAAGSDLDEQKGDVDESAAGVEEKVEQNPPVTEEKLVSKIPDENENLDNANTPIEVNHVEVTENEPTSQKSQEAEPEESDIKPDEPLLTQSRIPQPKVEQEKVTEVKSSSTELTEAHSAKAKKTNNSAEDTRGGSDRSWIRKMRHIMAFKSMPPANIKRLLECMESVEVSKGETIVKQGTPGDYYYVLTEGKATVSRVVELATLEPGRSFGEEALISDDIRNASVTMETDGIVMRLSKKDFSQLLEEPLLHRLSPGDARIHIANGAIWLDVRHAQEYQHSHLAEAINIPLHELRSRLDELNPETPIICYCSTGRRSAAAAFLLAQNEFTASVLNGGVRVMAQDLKRPG